ncbi:MAG: VOC family protein [Spirochaetes bacterium]|nr:VOC family protein [Spirochaetota bacterium]
MKLNHLGYASRNIDEAISAFLKLGYVKVHEEVKHHIPKNMFVQRVKLNDTIVEIMAPADASKPSFISGELGKTSEPFVLHHLCYDVEDIRKAVDGLMATGEYSIYEPITSGVFQKNLICFLRHKHIGLIEFFEWPKN